MKRKHFSFSSSPDPNLISSIAWGEHCGLLCIEKHAMKEIKDASFEGKLVEGN
jgi:hypothetical protein